MRDRILTTLAAATLLAAVAPSPSGAQTTFEACYVPDVGALYLINLSGLPTSCLAAEHEAISWTEGSGVTDHGDLTGLADDDHGQYVLVDGVRNATNGFAVAGGTGAIPIEGTGTRIMWYPDKSAFRAGRVEGAQWDDVNVGTYSVAMGLSTTASGQRATATGSHTTASGLYSTAFGINTTASGNSATATGFGTTASGQQAMTTGLSTTASGIQSVAMGRNTTAQSARSLVIGRYNVVEGDPDGWFSADPLFVAGNGTSTDPSNALTLYKNGNVTIAGNLTESSDARLKRGVEALGDVLDDLRSIRPVRFRFREGTGHPTETQIGLLAQEVQQVFPELVTRDSEGYLSLAYPKLTAVLVKALQEQQEEVEEQRARLEEKEEALERMAERLDRLEATVERLQRRKR